MASYFNLNKALQCSFLSVSVFLVIGKSRSPFLSCVSVKSCKLIL